MYHDFEKLDQSVEIDFKNELSLNGFSSIWKNLCIEKYLKLQTNLRSSIWSFHRTDKCLVSFMFYRAEFHVVMNRWFLDSFNHSLGQNLWWWICLRETSVIQKQLWYVEKNEIFIFSVNIQYHTSCCNRLFTRQVRKPV